MRNLNIATNEFPTVALSPVWGGEHILPIKSPFFFRFPHHLQFSALPFHFTHPYMFTEVKARRPQLVLGWVTTRQYWAL